MTIITDLQVGDVVRFRCHLGFLKGKNALGELCWYHADAGDISLVVEIKSRTNVAYKNVGLEGDYWLIDLLWQEKVVTACLSPDRLTIVFEKMVE